MSGPIVRSGPSPEFSENWEKIFGKEAATSKPKKNKKSATKAKAGKKKKPKKK